MMEKTDKNYKKVVEELTGIYEKSCKEKWYDTIKLIKKEAQPSEVAFIKKHEEIFYKMYRQGFQRGWKAGGYVVYDLMNHILGEEVMTSSDMWHKMHVVLDHTETKQ